MENVNLVLGTMTFGESVSGAQATEIIRTFLDAGYDDLDTAYVYNGGDSERIIGAAISELERPVRIATKVNPRVSGKLDGEAVYRQVNESLERMGVSSVDTVYLHYPDPATPVISALEAMAELHDAGKYRVLGLSNFPAWMVSDIWHICEEHRWVKPGVFEGIYNPFSRRAETELNDCLRNFNMRFHAYNPLCGGLLTGRYGEYTDLPTAGRFASRPSYRGRYWKKSCFDATHVIQTAAEKHGITPVEATYRWLAHHSMLNAARGDGIIVGASKLGQLRQNLETIKAGPLPQDVTEAFEKAWIITKADSPEYFRLWKG